MKQANLRSILCLLPGGPGLAQTDLISAVEIAIAPNAIDQSPFEDSSGVMRSFVRRISSAWIARSNATNKAWPDRQKRSVAADRL